MKRDWDVIREVLIEIEELSPDERDGFLYGRDRQDESKTYHALLLWEAGFVRGIDSSSTMGPALLAPDLTWEGHDLLATLRSKPVWERIKSTAREKGVELSVDAVRALGKLALDWVLNSG